MVPTPPAESRDGQERDFPCFAARESKVNAFARPLVIEGEGLGFSYGNRQILQELDVRVGKAEILTIMGPSGCGKTTLLRLMVGLARPQSGSLKVLGEDYSRMDEDDMNRFRHRLGMCFQFGALLNSLPIYDNLALPLRERWKSPPESLVSLVVRSKLAMVGLLGTESLLPSELSGGMRKRAGLARALMLDPELLFFDEPTSGLDPVTAADLDRTVLELRRRLQTTMVVVTHDLASAWRISDRILVLLHGRIAVQGTREEIENCSDPEVQAFIQRESPARRQSLAGGFLDDYFEIESGT